MKETAKRQIKENSLNAELIKKNVSISVLAQMVSLGLGLLVSFILPKFLDVHQYAWWQAYVLYVNYTGIFHLGLLDGIVLRYSQYDYDELDQPTFRSQFQALVLFNSVAAAVGIAVAHFAIVGEYKTVIILSSIGIITKNVFTYTSYTFQITNRINRYATLVILQKCFYGIGIIALLLGHVTYYVWFCIIDLTCDVLVCVISAPNNKGLYWGKTLCLAETIQEIKNNVSSGIILMMANWTSNLLVGGAKMLVQWRWGSLTFGKVAFSFSITGVFLTFVTAISIVLFPSLKRMDQKELPNLYRKIQAVLSPMLFIAMLFYFPGCWILGKWLPQYSISLKYFGTLLPIIVYSSKVSLLTNNYLKTYRKEKWMLAVNLFSVLVAITGYALCAYVFNNLDALLYFSLFVIMLRSILSEITVSKIIGISVITNIATEILMTIAFLMCTRLLGRLAGLGAYSVCLAAYGGFKRKQRHGALQLECGSKTEHHGRGLGNK